MHFKFCIKWQQKDSFSESIGSQSSHRHYNNAITIRLIVPYRPPKAPKGIDFFSDFVDIIDQYLLMSGQLFIVGDYNIQWDCNENTTTKRLIDILASTNLTQHVWELTHRDGHITGLAVTRQDDNIVHMTSVHSMISDLNHHN
ncbi:hypothetical protein LSH36_275g08025 [Paralvinella palmiformis]|uniref:Endonuclease/exonuclease/phosphatase domain-containing protein n=1 Tax=Paralvinella palmiformis TaxID=53620 RepID=A0AAD9N3K8_9ANNE|nr:hypothetical protein LSH36_275g08025 [Paralvinella palmiformis]